MDNKAIIEAINELKHEIGKANKTRDLYIVVPKNPEYKDNWYQLKDDIIAKEVGGKLKIGYEKFKIVEKFTHPFNVNVKKALKPITHDYHIYDRDDYGDPVNEWFVKYVFPKEDLEKIRREILRIIEIYK